MRVLVTGATGLLGSHVVEALLAVGHEVRALVRPTSDVSFIKTTGATIVQGDLDDPSSLRAAADSCDGVIHTAAVVGEWQPWSEFFRVGVLGTRTLLSAARAVAVWSAMRRCGPLSEARPRRGPNWCRGCAP
mgnify:CR=1 FL=1